MLPEWLPDPDVAPPSSSWMDRASARLEGGTGALMVVAPPSLARRALLSALAQRHQQSCGGALIAARLAGCETADDIARALGQALGVPARGDLSAVAVRLGALPSPLVLLDDAPAGPTASALQAALALAPAARFLLAGERACEELDHLAGPKPTSSAPPEGALSSMPPEAADLALLPWGVRDDGSLTLPAELRLPVPGRVALRPELIAPLLGARSPAPEAVARRVQRFAADWLPLAEGAPMATWDEEADLLLLRFLARHHPDLALATRAAAAAARLLAAAGHGAAARGRRAQAARRAAPSQAPLLAWAEGDILLSFGLLREATRCHREAADALDALGDTLGRAALLTHTASQLLELGLTDEARLRARDAQRLCLRAGERREGVGPLRVLADLAVSEGEIVAADGLLSQAEAEAARAEDVSPAALTLSRAGLAVARGELGAARALLQLRAPQPPELSVYVDRRRADLLLRQGRHAEVLAIIPGVAERLRRLGQRAAAAAAIRLRGDALALGGRPLEAAESYARALDEAARAGDLHGARRSLSHLLTLERAGTDRARVEELLTLLAELDTELGAPERRDDVRLQDEAEDAGL